MMRFTGARAARVAALVLTIGVVLGLASASAGAAGSTNPKQVDGKGIITIEQTNLCLWGSIYYANDGCLHNPYYTKATNPTEAFERAYNPKWAGAEAHNAAVKRASLIAQIRGHVPDVVTVNEACSADMDAVAKATGYHVSYFQTGSAPPHRAANKPRACTVGRGYSVNAVLARTIIASGPRGYFPVAGGSYRSYVCAQVSTSEWKSVRVCTAHLSLQTQSNKSLGKGRLQQAECSYLSGSVLNRSSGYVLFAGDLNRSGRNQNCAPSRFHGLKDAKYGSARSITHDGLQHIYYSAGFWRQTCGWAYTVDSTDDHKGFLLELGKKAPRSSASCGVREIRG